MRENLTKNAQCRFCVRMQQNNQHSPFFWLILANLVIFCEENANEKKKGPRADADCAELGGLESKFGQES